MSDTLEIVEITDTSIVISPELIKTNSSKRTYNEHDSEPDGIDESILKKGRVDILEELEQETSEIDVSELSLLKKKCVFNQFEFVLADF